MSFLPLARPHHHEVGQEGKEGNRQNDAEESQRKERKGSGGLLRDFPDAKGARGSEFEEPPVASLAAVFGCVERLLVSCQGLFRLPGFFVGLAFEVMQAGFEFADVVPLAERERLLDVRQGCLVLLFEKADQGPAITEGNVFTSEVLAFGGEGGQVKEDSCVPVITAERVSQRQRRIGSGVSFVILGQVEDASGPRELSDDLVEINAGLIGVEHEVQAGFGFP